MTLENAVTIYHTVYKKTEDENLLDKAVKFARKD